MCRRMNGTRGTVVSLLLGTGEYSKQLPTLWDFDSYSQMREHTEKLHYHQMLLGKDLAGEASLTRQLTEQLAEQVQALDQHDRILPDAQRRLLTEREEERKHLARERHDQIIQDLSSINYELEGNGNGRGRFSCYWLENPDRSAPGNPFAGGKACGVFCGNLRPLTIDSLGLGAALKSLSRDWSAAHRGEGGNPDR